MEHMIGLQNFMCGNKYVQFNGLNDGKNPWYCCLDNPAILPLDTRKIDDFLMDCFMDVREERGWLNEDSSLKEIVQDMKIPFEQFKRIPRSVRISQDYYMEESTGEGTDSSDFHDILGGVLLFSRIKSVPYSIHTHSSSERGSMVCLLPDNKLGVFDVSNHNGGLGLSQGSASEYDEFSSRLCGVLKCI